MIRAKVLNVCFQMLAAFWAAVVILKAQTASPWHAYAIAAVGVVVLSFAGTRLKRRIQSRIKAST
ncbi:MAG: hypothetical protein JO249_08835 [Acidobacteria bacterium]|nr:hypothetical protein [Acidobacteriota bacterium]